MSNRTDDEEMARRMRPGLRVIRGKNWIFGEIDGNGPGTVIREHPKFKHWWQVKWDRTGKTDYHQMGTTATRLDTTRPSGEKIYRWDFFSVFNLIQRVLNRCLVLSV